MFQKTQGRSNQPNTIHSKDDIQNSINAITLLQQKLIQFKNL